MRPVNDPRAAEMHLGGEDGGKGRGGKRPCKGPLEVGTWQLILYNMVPTSLFENDAGALMVLLLSLFPKLVFLDCAVSGACVVFEMLIEGEAGGRSLMQPPVLC